MKTLRKLSLLMSVSVLTMMLVGTVGVRAEEGDMKTFLDTEVPGIRIQVNATSETRPADNLTVVSSLRTQTNVFVERFNLELFGFLNGTMKLSMVNVTDDSFLLNSTSKAYSITVDVPDSVWGIMYGEVKLTYSANLGGLELRFPNIVTGFPMTQVENTFLKGLEDQLRTLSDSYSQLTDLYENLTAAFSQLNETYFELQQNYTSIQGSLGDLDNTRRLTTILTITTVFFLATTVYLVIRKPKELW